MGEGRNHAALPVRIKGMGKMDRITGTARLIPPAPHRQAGNAKRLQHGRRRFRYGFRLQVVGQTKFFGFKGWSLKGISRDQVFQGKFLLTGINDGVILILFRISGSTGTRIFIRNRGLALAI